MKCKNEFYVKRGLNHSWSPCPWYICMVSHEVLILAAVHSISPKFWNGHHFTILSRLWLSLLLVNLFLPQDTLTICVPLLWLIPLFLLKCHINWLYIVYYVYFFNTNIQRRAGPFITVEINTGFLILKMHRMFYFLFTPDFVSRTSCRGSGMSAQRVYFRGESSIFFHNIFWDTKLCFH